MRTATFYALILRLRTHLYTYSLNLKWLRNQISVVEQTTTLFPGSIFDNIAMGKLGATMDDVIQAATLVCFRICRPRLEC
jgi:ABC-type multidrug transport system fused ATPase/permease subunit